MEKVARGFCKGINGVFAGCIGALDGWLVKIEKPSLIRDGVQNPSLYFSRKGFYGVNVQITVSHNKTFCIVEQNMIQLHLKMGLLENGWVKIGNHSMRRDFIFSATLLKP